MLRFLQERVNKKTKKVDERAAENGVVQDEYDELSTKQARVKELMRRLAVKLGKENDVEEDR